MPCSLHSMETVAMDTLTAIRDQCLVAGAPLSHGCLSSSKLLKSHKKYQFYTKCIAKNYVVLHAHTLKF